MKVIFPLSLLVATVFAAPAAYSGKTAQYQPYELWQDKASSTADSRSWVLSPTSQAPLGSRSMLIKYKEHDAADSQTFTVTVDKNVQVQKQNSKPEQSNIKAPASSAKVVQLSANAAQLLEPLDMPVETVKLLLANNSNGLQKRQGVSNIPAATEQIGKQIGGPIGVAIGSALGNAIGKAIGGPIGLAIGNAIVSFLPA